MVARSSVSKLPNAVRSWLKSALIENNFSEYELLAEELKSQGFSISKSALQRDGSKLQRQLARMKDSSEASNAIADAVKDDEGNMAAALVAQTMEQYHQFYMQVEEDGKLTPQALGELGKGVAHIVKASVTQKAFARKVRKEDAAKLAKLEAEAASGKPGKTGLDPDTLRRVREEIYGF